MNLEVFRRLELPSAGKRGAVLNEEKERFQPAFEVTCGQAKIVDKNNG